jgi:parvulin-like peptidyl-prolyl isomerase
MTKRRKTFCRSVLFLVAAMLSVSLICSCSNKKDTVMKIGGFDVSFEHYRYLYMNIRDELLSSETDYTAEELDTQIRDTVMKSLKHYASISELAKNKKISLTSDDSAYIDELVNETISDYGSEEEFQNALREAYSTEDFFRYALELQQLETKLRSYMTSEATGELAADDATIENDVYKNFYRAKQVLIKNDNGKSKTQNLELANKILSDALSGENFDTLIEEYSEDTTGGDYCFTAGQLLEEFENAVSSISSGEIYSEVVETEVGYHIVMRTDITEDYINSHFDDLRSAYLARRFNETLTEYSDTLEVKKEEIYDTLTEQNFILGSVTIVSSDSLDTK